MADVTRQVQSFERHAGKRKRRRRPIDQAAFEATVSAIVCDLMHHHLAGADGGVAITRSNTVLGRKSRYRPVAYGKTLPTILDRLSSPEMEFVEQQVGYQGYFGPARQTALKAGSRLVTRIEDHGIGPNDLGRLDGEELIILKRAKEDHWDEGGYLEYQDMPKTRAYRDQLRTINGWLTEADLAFDDAVLSEGKTVDISERRLRRIFTNGSFESGGRLFGGFWQALGKRQRRKGVLIEDNEAVTLDYSQMAPRALYGMAGAVPPSEDAYLIPGLENSREGVKKLFNALLFTDKPLSRMPKGLRALFPSTMKVREVVRRLEDAHPELRTFFSTNIGHKVQFIESQILVDLLLKLKEQEIVALPVHDAVIVPYFSVPTVTAIMKQVYMYHTGIEGLVKEEG